MRSNCSTLFAAVVAVVCHATTAAALVCGDTLPAGTTVMTDDLGPCSAVPHALRIPAGATLDMAGHRVSCPNDGAAGIRVEGGTVKNGSVMDCANGFLLIGDGSRAFNVVANGSAVGIQVSAPDADVERSHAINCLLGFTATAAAQEVRFEDCTAVGNSEGFRVAAGVSGAFEDCVASGNATTGFSVENAPTCAATGSKAVGNGGIGFAMDCTEMTVKDNLATQNDAGFQLGGAAAVLDDNTAADNGGSGIVLALTTSASARDCRADGNAGDGILITGDGSFVRDAVVVGNGGGGIVVTRGAGHLIRTSSVHRNAGSGISLGATADADVTGNVAIGNALDLEDEDPACSGDDWTANVAGSASPACAEP